MDNIALAFSGGGFRAACFSLGSLSYLHHLTYGAEGRPLLEKVTYISSTSGGSIANLAYSTTVFKGQSFHDFYDTLRSQLSDEKLLDAATKALHTASAWKERKDKSQNLINAFSLIYDQWLQGATLSLFSDRSHNPHLQEVCINATEFTNGLPFRFQSQYPAPAPITNGKVGNFFIFFDRTKPEVFGNLKLADILAASSCFPSGFEPIIFPEDFTHSQLTAKQLRDAIHYTANTFTLKEVDKEPPPQSAEAVAASAEAQGQLRTGDQPVTRLMKYGNPDILKDKRFTEELHIGLMDGGVDDNQAIGAFEKAYERRIGSDNQFDLLIACDVTSNFMDGYTLPLAKKGGLFAIPAWMPLIGVALVWLLLAAFLPYMLFTRHGNWTTEAKILAVLSGLFDLPLLLLLFTALKALVRKKQTPAAWSMMLRRYGPRFLALSTGTLLQMLAARFKSVYLLANDIYLKQIRRMYYNDIFEIDPRFRNMTIQNTIYDLSNVKFGGTQPPDPPVPGKPPTPFPSQQMIDIAETARLMGTTLWFDQNNRAADTMKKIIVTGQFTTCYNLLKYVNKLSAAGPLTAELQQLQTSLQRDWEAFRKNADFLY